MTYGTKNGTVAVKAISAVLFLVFVFCYLYFYQADILAVSSMCCRVERHPTSLLSGQPHHFGVVSASDRCVCVYQAGG